MLVRNVSRNLVLGTDVRRADTFLLRLRGLMLSGPLDRGEGLWIEPCNSVHTHFMRFPIDVIFLDHQQTVVHAIPAMAPWSFSPLVKGSVSVLELPAGAAQGTVVGDRIMCEG